MHKRYYVWTLLEITIPVLVCAMAILSMLGDEPLTRELDEALSRLATTLYEAARRDTANAVRAAHEALAASVGTLSSRSTRVPHAGA